MRVKNKISSEFVSSLSLSLSCICYCDDWNVNFILLKVVHYFTHNTKKLPSFNDQVEREHLLSPFLCMRVKWKYNFLHFSLSLNNLSTISKLLHHDSCGAYSWRLILPSAYVHQLFFTEAICVKLSLTQKMTEREREREAYFHLDDKISFNFVSSRRQTWWVTICCESEKV